MPNRGFEVELVLALHGLLRGRFLEKSEFQVINCATEEEKFKAFDKVVSILLYANSEQAMQKVRNFKLALGLIQILKNGSTITLKTASGFEKISLMSKQEFMNTYVHLYDSFLEKSLRRLISGEQLTEIEILGISVAEEIELFDIFSIILIDILSKTDDNLAEVADLNIFILKSLKLTNSFEMNGISIDSISREDYELAMTKSEGVSAKLH